MLIDCARMESVWNIAEARRADKDALTRLAAATPDRWGALAPGWNARDLEYVPGQSGVLHYTTLHLQPWQPFPEQYSYHPHPLAELWLELERAADAEGYRVFTRARPSARFAEALARHHGARPAGRRGRTPVGPAFGRLAAALGIHSVLHCRVGGEAPGTDGLEGPVDVAAFDLAAGLDWPGSPADAVVAAGLLEPLPVEDTLWVLDELFAHARDLVHVVVDAGNARRPAPAAARWHRVVAAAASQHPKVAWRLDVRRRRRLRGWEVVSFESRPDEAGAAAPPRVWTLLGEREGDNAQIRGLAEALGWPAEAKRLTYTRRYKCWNLLLGASLLSLDRRASSALVPPWPDLVIAAGRRSAPVARWIRKQSGGRARLVHIGRPWAPLRCFDLVITTPQYGLPQRPNVLHNALPIIRGDASRLAEARTHWAPRLAALPRPLVALLVGGDSPPYVLDPTTAERLGQQARDGARALGGTLVVTCGPRVRAPAVEALAAATRGAGHFHRWRPDDPDNPYLAYLALADRFIVTGDSASMLAEACLTGKPVSIFPLPERADWRWWTTRRVQRWVERRQSRPSVRGTVRQQDWVGRLWDRLVGLGLIKRTRDLTRVHRVVEAREVGTAAPDDLERAVARVRQLVRERPT
jgi:mitochondrial fission protein ELM1